MHRIENSHVPYKYTKPIIAWLDELNKSEICEGCIVKRQARQSNGYAPSRELYVAPVMPNTSKMIRQYFEVLEDYENMELRSKYAIVRFKTIEGAQFAHLKHYGCRLKAVVLKRLDTTYWHWPVEDDPMNPHLLAPTQDSPQHILTVNDDCIRKILKYLNANDLFNASQACVRFNQLVKDVFARKCPNLHITHNFIGFINAEKQQFKLLFQQFGRNIRSIAFEPFRMDTNPYVLRLLNQYCSPQLKHLKLHDFKLNGKSLQKMDQIFGHLESIEFVRCEFHNNFEGALNMCHELKKLHIEHCTMNDDKKLTFINQTFPKLNEAHFVFNDNLSTDVLSTFFASNTTLTNLTFKAENQSEVCKLIAKHLKHLKQLDYMGRDSIDDLSDAYTQNCLCLAELRELTVLKIDICPSRPTGQIIEALVANKVPIEHLRVLSSDDYLEDIAKMKTLKIVDLLFWSDHYELMEFANELPELQELHMISASSGYMDTCGLIQILAITTKLSVLDLENFVDVVVDEDDYQAILKTVRNRPQKTPLKINITHEYPQISLPEDHRDELSVNQYFKYANERIEYYNRL